MHSVKAGLTMPVVREAFTDFRLTNDPGDTCPESGHPLKLRMGEAGSLHRLQRLSGVHLDRRHPRDRGGPRGPHRSRGADLRRVRQPDAAAHGQERLELPRLHRLPEVPQRHLGQVSRRQGRSELGRAHRREVPGVRPRPGEAPRPLTAEYVSCSNCPNCRYKPPKPVTLTGVTCPECHQGQILERKGRFGPFYGCSRYPECTKNSARGRCRSRARSAAPPTCSCASARAAACCLRGRGLRLRRFGRRPRAELPLRHRGHRGSPPGRARVAATMKVAAKKTPRRRKKAGGGGGARRRAKAAREAAEPRPKPKPRAKAAAKKRAAASRGGRS